MSRPTSIRRLSVALVATTLLAACSISSSTSHHRIGSSPYVQGSGKVTTESRSPGTFHAVTATSGVEVSLSTGSSAAVSVTADDNLVSRVTTEVQAGTLVVGIEGSIETSNPLKVAITTPTAIDAIRADAGATIETNDLAAADLAVTATSGATLRAGGTARSLELVANSGATADLRNVQATTAHVQVDVGATAYVRASDRVSGTCSTGATLHVAGKTTTVDVQADVSSTVVRE